MGSGGEGCTEVSWCTCSLVLIMLSAYNNDGNGCLPAQMV